MVGGRPWHCAMCRRLPVHRRQDFCDNGHGGTEKLQPPLEGKTCHLFLDFPEQGMQGENLRVSCSHEMAWRRDAGRESRPPPDRKTLRRHPPS
jgi:hypothetical protein